MPHETTPASPSDQPAAGAAAELTSRRRLLGRAAVGIAATGATATLLEGATAAASGSSPARVLSFLATQEGFGVTFLTEAIRRAPGTPSSQFLDVLKAANTAEFDHVRALRRLGFRPQVRRYWIPDAAFGAGGAGLFRSIEQVETIEISLYLVGVTAFTRTGNAFRSRLCAEALGLESQHRVLARAAQLMLGATTEQPNDISFERYGQRSVRAARTALEGLGIGYGTPGAQPGRFYEYPGNPLANGTGLPLESRTPA